MKNPYPIPLPFKLGIINVVTTNMTRTIASTIKTEIIQAINDFDKFYSDIFSIPTVTPYTHNCTLTIGDPGLSRGGVYETLYTDPQQKLIRCNITRVAS